MVHTFFLGGAASPGTSTTVRGTWNTTTSHEELFMGPKRRGGNVNVVLAETSATNPFNRLLARFLSDPLSEQILSGSITFKLRMAEINADADYYVRVHGYVLQGDTDTVRGTFLTNFVHSSELPVEAGALDTAGVLISNVAITPVNVQLGDRLCLEIGFQSQNSHTTSRNCKSTWGGLSGTIDGSETGIASATNDTPNVVFSSDIIMARTYLYLTSDSAPGTSISTRGTWDASGSPNDRAISRVPSGSREQNQKSETVTTNPWDVLIYRGISEELSTQVIDGTLRMIGSVFETAADADVFLKRHIYIMKPDGTVRATILANTVHGSETNTSVDAQSLSNVTVSSVSVVEGDRLVVEIGARFTNVTATSKTASHYIGGTTSEAAGGDSMVGNGVTPWISFNPEISFYTPANSERSHIAVVG